MTDGTGGNESGLMQVEINIGYAGAWVALPLQLARFAFAQDRC